MRKVVRLVLFPVLCACSAPKDEGSSGGVRPPPPATASCPVAPSSLHSPLGSAPFSESRKSFITSNGVSVERHVITEQERNGHTLLLVVENPRDPSLAQRVVQRKSFSPGEQLQLEQARTTALSSETSAEPFLTISNNPVWPHDRSWTPADEADYSRWVEANVAEDMLAGTGIEVDCAEYAMTLRWIYARNHHLPAGDKQSGSGKLWGSWQSTTEWDALPTAANWKDDRRFKAALHYALSNSYTHALLDDLYPVAITPQYVTGGTIYLTLWTTSGHTRTIFKVGNGGACSGSASCISIIYGTLPASENGYITTLSPYVVDEGWGGLMRFRWPEKIGGVWNLRAPNAMPGYSREQFLWTDAEYGQKIADRLGLWSSAEERLLGMGRSLVESVNLRLRVTERGYYLCSLIPCSTSDSIYNDWSTPERDATLAAQLRSFQATNSLADQEDSGVRSFFLSNSSPLFEGTTLSRTAIFTGNVNTQFSSDPRVAFFSRWGLGTPTPESELKALARVAFDNWRWRDDLVAQAQSLCFAGNGASVTCDPNSSQVRALSTTRLDQAFVKAQGEFERKFRAASASVQSTVKTQLDSEFTGAFFCSPSSCGNSCPMSEFLLNSPEHLRTMSSNPLDPLARRYGFQASF